VLTSLGRLGINHKHVVARTTSGRIVAHLCESLGSETLYEGLNSKDSREATESVFKSATILMTDASLDVRQAAKNIFAVLMENPKFEMVLKMVVPHEQIGQIRKQLDALSKQMNPQK
jgi:hypothetical protein